MTLSQRLNQQRTSTINLRKQSYMNTPLPPSKLEQEWVLSNPNPDAAILDGVNLLRWHVHMEQLDHVV